MISIVLKKKKDFWLQGELEEKWDDLSENVSELLQDLEKIDEQVSPFDATSDVNIDDQR